MPVPQTGLPGPYGTAVGDALPGGAVGPDLSRAPPIDRLLGLDDHFINQ
ncbi:MAG TPA: hypothetical protein VFA09_00500 [Ktedonobacteraceae bacterium]|nr:hypothetical protein [Ktedonobacteraceae bacterium]